MLLGFLSSTHHLISPSIKSSNWKKKKKFKLCHNFTAPESPLKSWLISPYQYISLTPNIQLLFSYEINRRKRAELGVFKARSSQRSHSPFGHFFKINKNMYLFTKLFLPECPKFSCKIYLRQE